MLVLCCLLGEKRTIVSKLANASQYILELYVSMGCTQSKATDAVKDNKPAESAPPPQKTKSPAKKGMKSLIPESESSSFRITQPPQGNKDGNNKANEPALLTDTVSSGDVEKACFGAGCYWGTEKYFKYNFTKKFPQFGIVNGEVGFMGPSDAPANPTYREVCSGSTGHVEVFNFEYTGGDLCYEQLVRYFFQFHDPTTFNRQGNDKGTQYASVIYCYTDKQLEIANRIKAELQQYIDARQIRCFKEYNVSTDIRMSTIFYPAHAEHQDYLAINPNGYCNHKVRFETWPTKVASD